MVIRIETLRAHERAIQLAQELGIPLREVVDAYATWHERHGFKVIRPPKPIPTTRFRGLGDSFALPFRATAQM